MTTTQPQPGTDDVVVAPAEPTIETGAVAPGDATDLVTTATVPDTVPTTDPVHDVSLEAAVDAPDQRSPGAEDGPMGAPLPGDGCVGVCTLRRGPEGASGKLPVCTREADPARPSLPLSNCRIRLGCIALGSGVAGAEPGPNRSDTRRFMVDRGALGCAPPPPGP